MMIRDSGLLFGATLYSNNWAS